MSSKDILKLLKDKQIEFVDLRFVTPIATGLQNVPGEQGNFTQTGLEYDGIRPYRTYYYILTPIDNIGNELTTLGGSSSSNVHRVYIEDQYWQYNQHRIPEPPEPPEPPYGIEWLGDLEDSMEQENFQLAGIILLLSMIGAILLTFRKRTGVKKQSYFKQISRNPSSSVELQEVQSNKGVKVDD